MEGRRDMQAAGLRPLYLKGGKAVAYAVRQIEQKIGRGGQHVELLTHGGSAGCGPFIFGAARQNLPIKRQQGPLALADLGGKVLTAVFHVGEKHVLLGNVAVVGGLQDRSETGRRQAVGHVAPPLKVEHGRQAAARFRLLRGKRITLARTRFGRSSENHVHPPNVSKPSIPSSSLGRTPHGL